MNMEKITVGLDLHMQGIRSCENT